MARTPKATPTTTTFTFARDSSGRLYSIRRHRAPPPHMAPDPWTLLSVGCERTPWVSTECRCVCAIQGQGGCCMPLDHRSSTIPQCMGMCCLRTGCARQEPWSRRWGCRCTSSIPYKSQSQTHPPSRGKVLQAHGCMCRMRMTERRCACRCCCCCCCCHSTLTDTTHTPHRDRVRGERGSHRLDAVDSPDAFVSGREREGKYAHHHAQCTSGHGVQRRTTASTDQETESLEILPEEWWRPTKKARKYSIVTHAS
jgi:hypothetical protein